MPIPKRYLVTALLGILGAIIAWLVFQLEQRAVNEQLIGFPSAKGSGHELRPYLLSSLFFFPFLTAFIYCLANTIDRYVFKNFITAFIISVGALSLIWVLVDLQDNLSDLKNAESTLKAIGAFYASQMPAIALILLPNALLFSLLYALGKMSTSREIVAIIQTGRGVLRLITPLLCFGLICAAVCCIFNYHWGPYAEGAKDVILDRIAGRKASSAKNVAHFIPEHRRLWTVTRFPDDLRENNTLEGVSVTVAKDNGKLDYRLLAETAVWHPDSRTWAFTKPTIIKHTFPAPLDISQAKDDYITSWTETPWQLIQPGLSAQDLGIPGINTWLRTNQEGQWIDRTPFITQWHYRWAQPFICLVTVMLAAPLGIVFGRRGAAGGVALAVALCLGMLLSTNVFLALGEAGYIPPVLAAWATNILFAIIALLLLQRRIVGRPIYQTLRRLVPVAS